MIGWLVNNSTIMAMPTSEEMSASLHRGLSEWWSEETDYIFQRIERWAALARGYNRLRSQRLSRGRLTMNEEQESRWSISSNKIVIEDPNWCPRFHNLRRSHRRKSRSDEHCRINCCAATFNYQSNSSIDNNCLENYRYDHSIYFKTIGDIKSGKRDNSASESEGDDVRSGVDREAESPQEIYDYFCRDEDDDLAEFSKESAPKNAWPIVELEKLNLEVDYGEKEKSGKEKSGKTNDATAVHDDNNNFHENDDNSADKTMQAESARVNFTVESATVSYATGVTSSRKSRRNCRKIRQPTVVGDNNVLWPGVLLNYTKNVDNSALSPHHYRAVRVK